MWKKIRNPWHYGAGFCDWMLVDDFSICLRVPIAKSWFFGVQSPVLLLWVCLKIIGKNKFPWLIRCLIFQHGGKVLSNFPHSNCNFILYIYTNIYHDIPHLQTCPCRCRVQTPRCSVLPQSAAQIWKFEPPPLVVVKIPQFRMRVCTRLGYTSLRVFKIPMIDWASGVPDVLKKNEHVAV